MKQMIQHIGGLIILMVTVQMSYAQCSSEIISGHQILTPTQGCAPYDIYIKNLYTNSTADAIYTVDWGDGNVETLTGDLDLTDDMFDPIYTPDFMHTYEANEVDCGYTIIIEATNPCTLPEDARIELAVSVWDTDHEGLAIGPNEVRVCQGFAASVSFEDESDWNCFPRASRQNDPPRYIQWVYNGGSIGGISIPGLGSPVASGPVIPVMTTGEMSETINIPAMDPENPGNPYAIGDEFVVTLNNWNQCNPPGNDPITTTARIVVVDAPDADFLPRSENASNPVKYDFCIDEIIYYDNESYGSGGANLNYVWEFYDGPTDSDPLLNTRNDRNPVFSYSTGGQKLVRLYVGDGNVIGDCNSMIEKVVNITPTSIAQIDASGTKFCKAPGSLEVVTVSFEDVSVGTTLNTEWKWEFYDENDHLIRTEPPSGYANTTIGPFTQDYVNDGTYRVRLITRDATTGCFTDDEVTIVLYNNPEPDFIVGPVCEGVPSELIDQSSLQSINGSGIVRWEWDFDYDGSTFIADQTFVNSRPDTLTNIFPNGSHTVALRTTIDQNGCSATVVKDIRVYKNPVASFTKNIGEGCSPLDVVFTNTSLGSQVVEIREYVWRIDYGDGFENTDAFDPSDPGFTPDYSKSFENWSRQSKSFRIQLQSISENGCSTNSRIDSVKVLPSLKSGFNYVNYNPLASNCSPVDVTFQADRMTMELEPDYYHWTITKDGEIVDEQHILPPNGQLRHLFTSTGNGINSYQVNLNVGVDDICMSDSTVTINVNPVPTSGFIIDTVLVTCDSMIFEITANQRGLLNYEWVTTEGGLIYMKSGFQDQFIHTVIRPDFSSSGVDLSVELKTANYANCESNVSVQAIVVPQKPALRANFMADPERMFYPNTSVRIDNFSTSTNGSYFWDLGDGNTSTQTNPGDYTYSGSGEYMIRLEIEEDHCISKDSVRIEILPTMPIADFNFDPGSGCAPLTVHFTNLSKFADPEKYLWNFGGGEGISTAEHPTHTFHEPGLYSVRLEVANETGMIDTEVKKMIIEVYPRPHADFQIRPSTVMLPDDPIYTTNLSYGADSYYWDFGDGSYSEDFEPGHVYVDTGKYDISLIAVTDYGCSDTVLYENIVEAVNGEKIRIPNAFSPSLEGPGDGYRYGNGRNDVFYPVTEGVIAYKMQIYNRWGEMLFMTEDLNKGWTGYYKGKVCPPDVYIYKIDFKFIDGHEEMKFGDVTLIR
jgi:gliding motility-associated-like protein